MLEGEAGYQDALPRQDIGAAGLDECCRVHVAEARESDAVCRPSLGGRCVGRRRIVPEGAIEDVAEFGADIETVTFLDPEGAAEIQVFSGTALGAVVVIVSGR